MSNNTSQHILNTSATLLGFCLFVNTSIHLANKAAGSMVDELTAIVSITLTTASMFSFFSIRTKNETKSQKLETVADYLFIFSLVGLMIIIIFVSLHFIR